MTLRDIKIKHSGNRVLPLTDVRIAERVRGRIRGDTRLSACLLVHPLRAADYLREAQSYLSTLPTVPLVLGQMATRLGLSDMRSIAASSTSSEMTA